MGHSFVYRLAAFVQKKRHLHAFVNLHTIADIHFHGVGGRTIKKFRKFDLEVVRQIAPKVIILELGSNDLVSLSPQTVGSELENLVRELHEAYSVEFVVVGQVLRRRTRDADEYNCKVGKLNQYLKVVLEQLPFAITGDIEVSGTPKETSIYPMESILTVKATTNFFVVFERLF